MDDSDAIGGADMMVLLGYGRCIVLLYLGV